MGVHLREAEVHVAVCEQADGVEARRKPCALLGQRVAEGSVGDEAVTPARKEKDQLRSEFGWFNFTCQVQEARLKQ